MNADTQAAEAGAGRAIRPDHEALYAVAEAQAGYFTRLQALQVGFSSRLLTHHTKSGRFLRVAPGVYRLAQFPASQHEEVAAALLAAGPRAVVSRQSALAVYDLSDILPDAIHLTLPRTASRRRAGVRMHTGTLGQEEVTRRDGLRITSVPRTIVDVAAGGLPEEIVIQAATEAVRRGLASRGELLRAAELRGGRAARLVRRALAGERPA